MTDGPRSLIPDEYKEIDKKLRGARLFKGDPRPTALEDRGAVTRLVCYRVEDRFVAEADLLRARFDREAAITLRDIVRQSRARRRFQERKPIAEAHVGESKGDERVLDVTSIACSIGLADEIVLDLIDVHRQGATIHLGEGLAVALADAADEAAKEIAPPTIVPLGKADELPPPGEVIGATPPASDRVP